MALVVLGLGNDLLGDDGIGLLAAASLEGSLGPGVSVARSGRSGLYLVEELEGYEDAIILDSVLGDHPGRVRELRADEFRALGPSAHYAGLPEALILARSSGLKVPTRLRIFAVEIGVVQTIGAPPSLAVQSAIEELVSRVRTTAEQWGYLRTPEAVHA